MASISSVKYYRDDAALTILGNLTEQNSENTQTLADVSVRLSTLEDSSSISVMGSANSYAAGLVLAGNSTHGNEFLRKDGTWAPAPVAGLAPLASPAFTGTPTLPTGTTAITQAASDNGTKLATTEYVTSAINVLTNAAPGQLDTITELAAALGDDANYASATAAVIATKQPKPSEGAFVDGDKTKLDGIKTKCLFAATADSDFNLPVTGTNTGIEFSKWHVEYELVDGVDTARGGSNTSYNDTTVDAYTIPRAGVYQICFSGYIRSAIDNCAWAAVLLRYYRGGVRTEMAENQHNTGHNSANDKLRPLTILKHHSLQQGDKIRLYVAADNAAYGDNNTTPGWTFGSDPSGDGIRIEAIGFKFSVMSID